MEKGEEEEEKKEEGKERAVEESCEEKMVNGLDIQYDCLRAPRKNISFLSYLIS